MRLRGFRALTFDCYGTLIDWETGLLAALKPWATCAGVTADDDALLAAYARHESALEEVRPALPYPAVLAGAMRGIAEDFGACATDEDATALAGSVKDWPAFPDSAEALAYLKQHFMLIVVSNVDRRSFAASAARLGDPFHAVVTAEDVESYKPAAPHFERAAALLRQAGIADSAWLHVAQSLFHDIAPAKARGLATCWIDRRGGREGGATPDTEAKATPDLTLPSLAALVERHKAERG